MPVRLIREKIRAFNMSLEGTGLSHFGALYEALTDRKPTPEEIARAKAKLGKE